MTATILIIAKTLMVGVDVNISQLVLTSNNGRVAYEERRRYRRVEKCLQFQKVNREDAVVT